MENIWLMEDLNNNRGMFSGKRYELWHLKYILKEHLDNNTYSSFYTKILNQAICLTLDKYLLIFLKLKIVLILDM